MHGVNPGAEVGRYTLNAQIETVSGGERWTARDTALEHEVTLLVMPTEGDRTAAALDAARRAAGVEAAQLVRILDVGSEGALSYVCEEGLREAGTYAALIGAKGVPAEEVRRVTGEVATGLEAARSRGLHHLALVPESVLLTPDGRIKVRGLATTAALTGLETEGEEADRADATAVVALAYAGLTVTWPLATPSSLPTTPRGEDGPPPPSRVAVDVPGDLDTICRETLGEGVGPESPGDYAAQVAPWSRIPLAGSAHPNPKPGAVAGAVAAGAGTATAQRDAPPPSGPPPSGPGEAAGPGVDEDDVDEADTNEIPVYRADEPTEAIPTDPTGTPAGSPGATASDEDSAGGPVARTATAAGAVGAGAKVIGDRLDKVSKNAAERSREALHDARARREAIREDRTRHSSLGAAPVSGDIEPPAPLLPADAGRAPTRKQSNLVLALVSAFVVVACVVGAIGTSQIGDQSHLGELFTDDGTAPLQTTSPSGKDSSSGSGDSSSSSDEEKSKGPFAVLNAAGYDPEGDGVEHNAETPRVYDDDPSTAWTTEGYATSDFGGVKSGVGVTIDLGQVQKISSVTLDLPTATDATVYAGNQPTSSGTTIGASEGQTGEVDLEASQPVDARYVTVWFTSLAPDGEGRYRASLGEITVE